MSEWAFIFPQILGWGTNIPMLSCLDLHDKALSLGEGWVLMQSRQVPGRHPGVFCAKWIHLSLHFKCLTCRACCCCCCWLLLVVVDLFSFGKKNCYFLQFVLLWIPKIVESPKVTADRQAFLLQHEVGRKFLEAALLKSHMMEEERFISFFAEVCLKVIYRYISCMTYGRNELFIIYTNNMTG